MSMNQKYQVLKITLSITAVAAVLACSHAFAQSKVTTITVGAAAGGPADSIARHVARAIDKLVIIENKPGPAVTEAIASMRGAPTDGSRLIMLLLSEPPAPGLQIGDLVPVANLGESVSRDNQKRHYGLFAPPGTGISVVRSVEAAMSRALQRLDTSAQNFASAKYQKPRDTGAAALARLVPGMQLAGPDQPRQPDPVARDKGRVDNGTGETIAAIGQFADALA